MNEYFKNMPPYVYLPGEKALAAERAFKNANVSEIRLKPDEGIIFYTDKPAFLTYEGELSGRNEDKWILSSGEFEKTFEKMCQSSLYARQESVKYGYLTLCGGHRVGVCGRGAVKEGEVEALYDISALNIRISRQIFGAADGVIEHIAPLGQVKNTLIISPPGCGKTTILREVARLLGGGKYLYRVGIADERGEIAAMYGNKSHYDVGHLTFVYSDCPKDKAMMMALRSMGPDVLICDEIGGSGDERAIFSLVNAGVKIICSCHGFGREDVIRRGALGELLKGSVFERTIVLKGKAGKGGAECF